MEGIKIRHGLMSIAIIATAAIVVLLVEGSVATPAQTSEPSIQQLADDIQQRDAIIDKLVRRVEELGRRIGEDRSTSVEVRSEVSPSNHTELATAELDEPTQPPARELRAAAPVRERRPSAPAPGQFQISEGDAERALERTLIATGNLLVPSGFAEIEPMFGYTRREVATLVLFNLNRNELNAGLTARFGLPWESQLEASLPYNVAQQQITNAFVSPAQEVSNKWGNSVGDVTVGVAKTLVHESGWIPDVLGRITYETPTGPQSNNQVALPSHLHNLAFSTTAVKRQDPLVFVASVGYAKAFQMGQLDPGDQKKFQLGAFLGTSPETTLRGVLQQNFLDDTRVRDIRVPGSGSVQSILNFGGSSILHRGILLDLQLGIGLTSSAPKYSVVLSSTYRFGVPGL